MTYATFEDVNKRSFEDLSDYSELVATRLEDAEMMIRAEVPDLDEKVDSGELLQQAVIYVECEMIIRLARNPEGYVQEADGGYSYMLNQNLAAGELKITNYEWKLLGVSGGAYVIRPKVDIPKPFDWRLDW